MEFPLLQAHRGVSSDYPENTMTAFRGAMYQGYGVIELDPWYTSDGEIVILHDALLARTGRNADGSEISGEIDIRKITFAESQKYDMGLYVSRKYKGERIPLFSEVLAFAREADILLKIDNRYERFPQDIKEKLYNLVKSSGARAAFTVTGMESALEAMENVPMCEIHYDGKFSEETVKAFASVIPRERLVIWLPYENAATAWVKSGYATKEMCETVRKYARLGLWNLSEYEEYAIAREWGAYIVETNGKLKPLRYVSALPDTHVHSEYSHDSKAKIADIKAYAEKKGIPALCVTDHCDVEYFESIDLMGNAKAAVSALEEAKGLCKGIEIGEGIWNTAEAERIIKENRFDLVIGSVHAVRFEGYERPYSWKDFSEMDEQGVRAYLKAYFNDMLEMLEKTEMDILAHLTCPLRYINGKYGFNIDARDYESEIRAVLERVIKKKIVLEINTSCLGGNYDETMPPKWVLEMYKSMGGHLVSVGSDAHIAEKVGYGFERAKALLEEVGCEYICSFKDRYIVQYTLKKEGAS